MPQPLAARILVTKSSGTAQNIASVDISSSCFARFVLRTLLLTLLSEEAQEHHEHFTLDVVARLLERYCSPSDIFCVPSQACSTRPERRALNFEQKYGRLKIRDGIHPE
jgi:hypothetical protein